MDALVLVILGIAVVLAVSYIRKNPTSCGGDCAGCSGCPGKNRQEKS